MLGAGGGAGDSPARDGRAEDPEAAADQPGEDLAEAGARLGRLLVGRGWTVAVAESCTGGLLGAALTAASGSSASMRGGVIAYANDVKETLLGVNPELLGRHGAVSDAVARVMAEGVRRLLGTELGIAVTGVAGPAASEAKPAGLIYIGVATPGGTGVVRLDHDRGRAANRAGAVRAALAAAIEAVRESP